MIFALLLLALASLWGVLVTTRLPSRPVPTERLGLGIAFGLALALWLPVLGTLAAGIRLGPELALVGVLGLLALELTTNRVGALTLALELGSELSVLRRDARAQLLLGLFILLLALLGYTFYTHALEAKSDGLYSGGYSWGDQAFHATLASSFLYSENLARLQYPVYAGWPLGYPFVPDLLAAVLASLGLGFGAAFWVSALLALLAFCLLAYHLGRAWMGDGRFAAFGVLLLLLLSGGLGFLYFFEGLAKGGDFNQLLVGTDYANHHEQGINYSNLFNSLLLPARTALFGMALALAALLLLTKATDNGLKHREELLAAGVLAGLLPLVHTHSFLALAFVGACYVALFRGGEWKRWLWFFVPFAVLALPQVLWSSQQLAASGTSFVRFHFGWMSESPGIVELAGYWVKNAGVFFLLLVPAAWLAPRRLQKLALPFLALFIIGNLVVFQPHVYDNIKLFAYFHLAGAVLVALLLAKMWEKESSAWKTAAVALLLLSTLTGALALAREVQLSWPLVDNEGIAFAEAVRTATPPRAVFLTASDHNHPVTMLTGRTTLLGYKGWLWTHGIQYGERERDVEEIYAGSRRARELLQKYAVDYVVLGPHERREFRGLDETFFERGFTHVAGVGAYALYKVK